MLFVSFFKTLVGKPVTIELKNEVQIAGILHSVDQYLNFKLDSARVVDPKRFPQLATIKNIFIRGSVVRYVQVPAAEVETDLLQDASRKEAETAAGAPFGGSGTASSGGGAGGSGGGTKGGPGAGK